MNAEVTERAKDFPDLEIVFADAQQDNAKQVADVETFLRQRIDLLMISPNEAKPLTPVVERVFKAGIPVIVIDRGIEGDSYTVFIGADNYEIGRQAGEHIARLLDGRPAGSSRSAGSPGRRRRSTAARGCTTRSRSSRASRSSTTRSQTGCARRRWRRWRWRSRRNPRIDLVYAHNDPMAIGAYLAAKAKGREKEMKFIGIDALPGLDGGRQAVADGKLDATFVYPTGGRQAVELAEQILRGEQVPHRVVLPTEKITR